MNLHPNQFLFLLFSLAVSATIPSSAQAQPECAPWGNLYGIRVEGHLMDFESSVRILGSDGRETAGTGHYRVEPSLRREGKRQLTSTKVGTFEMRQVVAEGETGTAQVELSLTATTDSTAMGGYFCLSLPGRDFHEGTVEVLDGDTSAGPRRASELSQAKGIVKFKAKGLRFVGNNRHLEVTADAETEVILRNDYSREGGSLRAYLAVLSGLVKKGDNAKRIFTLQAAGEIDRSEAGVAIDAGRPGRVFDGIGGNFRIQFPKADPAIIDYNLEHLRVAWGRTCMWWDAWDPDEAADPMVAAKAGKLDARLREQVESDRKIAAKGIPIIVSTWDPPQWARLDGPRRPGTYGCCLNPAKWHRIVESITSYLVYLKQEFGVEAVMFSFNEPDIGVQVVQNPSEHIALIRLLGRRFSAQGLATRLLLADTSNATPYSLRFARAALDDPEARQYVAAIGFHTWGGCESENLVQWAEVSRQLNVPIMVTEAGFDSEGHRNPDLFLEPSYQLLQTEMYARLLALCQPMNILEWQLTADYSVLKGGGAYGNHGPLEPTQRFWLLKQLGATPRGSFALPTTCSHRLVTSAAFGDIANGVYTIHLVNNGAARQAKLAGLPPSASKLRVLVTDYTRGMVEAKPVRIDGGQATVQLDATSLTTVICAR